MTALLKYLDRTYFNALAPHLCLSLWTMVAGADPGAGKGRGTNKLSCRWLGEQIL